MPFGLGIIRGLLVLPLALVLFLPVFFNDAGAQQQLAPGAQSPAAQAPAPLAKAPPLVPAATPPTSTAPAPPAMPPAAAPMPPVQVDWGLCQCIADKTNLDFTCPGSADACQAACGKQFSFKPDARCRQTAATH